MTTATTQPSFAATLHKLPLGEEIPGDELLALPGFADVETEWPIHDCIGYSLDMIGAELITHAGKLAAAVDPFSAIAAGYAVEELREHIEKHGYVFEVIPEARSLLWQIGQDADLAIRLPKGK